MDNSIPKLTPVGSLISAICLINIGILFWLSDKVLKQEAFAFDEKILLWLHQFTNPIWDKIMLNTTKLGNPDFVIIITTLSFAILLWKSYLKEAAILVIHVIGGNLLSYLLKLFFHKLRPQLWQQLITENSFSFPSGHALGSMILYGFLAYLVASNYPKLSKLIYFCAAVFIGAVGFSRLYLGVHWLTDVIAGYAIGFLWLMFSITMLKLWNSYSEVTE